MTRPCKRSRAGFNRLTVRNLLSGGAARQFFNKLNG
jgi:hypothetical protein